MSDWNRYPVTFLRDLARRLLVRGAGKLRKSELVEALEARREEAEQLAGAPPESPPPARRVVRPEVAAMSASDEGPEKSALAGPTIGEEEAAARGLETLGSPPAPESFASGAGSRAPVPLTPPHVPPQDIPWAYDDDKVVLLVRDPRTLFVYWDFHPDTVRRAFSEVYGAHARLRLLWIDGSEHHLVQEIDVSLDARSWYLYELEPHRTYRVELVARNLAGEERLIGRPSNAATLPPNAPSAWVEDRFISLPLDVPLPGAALFGMGRLFPGGDRMHAHAFELSGGVLAPLGDEASSDRGIVQGFGGRSWSGTLVRK